MKKFIIRTLLFVLVSTLLIILISYSQKYLYRIFSSDFSRHSVIVDVLNEKSTCENVILFGASQSMSGVDTRIIRDSIHFKGEIYNLSSAAQSLYESSYYYSSVKSNTKMVIQCVSPSFFSKNEKQNLGNNLALSMFLSGYRINEETKGLLDNYNGIFDQHPLENYYASRTIFKSYIHNMIRPFIDNEVFDETARNSKYFPNLYINERQPNYNAIKSDCNDFKSKSKPVSQINLLRDVKKYFDSRGIQYLIVFMPVNPDKCSECYNDFHASKIIIEKETKISIIDLSEFILDTNLFYDAGHPNRKGAELISKEIAKQLKILNNNFTLSKQDY